MKKKLTAMLLAALMTLSLAVPASAAFSDVYRSDWYYSDVNAVEKYGIINGVGNGRFDPNGTLTLAEAITMVARADAYWTGVDIEEYYRDFFGMSAYETISPWYEPYLFYANDTWISPYGEYGDNYDAVCSRSVMAKLFSMVVYDEGHIYNMGNPPDTDDPDILWLYQLGILTGSDQYGTFHPYDSVTRAEAAAIINRVMDPSQRKTFELQTQIDNNGWKAAYRDFIRSDPNSGYHTAVDLDVAEYALFDVNQDGIPELWINYRIWAEGGVLCSVVNGKVEPVFTNVYFGKYIPGSSLCLDHGGKQGMYYDRVYQLVNGEFVLIGSGTYIEGWIDGYGYSGEYTYEWNGTIVSESAYHKALNAVFDTTQAVTLMDQPSYSYYEILQILQ